MKYTTREQWGARRPRNVEYVPKSRRKGVMFHYSAASPTQTPAAIQAYHMDIRGWADIGYNWLISSITGEIFEGRGWDVLGAHCAGHNTENIGVCIIGKDLPDRLDVSPAARAAGRLIYEEAVRHVGRNLAVLGHRDRAATACPGDELYDWLRKGMPVTTTTPPMPPAPPVADWTERMIMALPTIRRGSTGEPVRTAQGLLCARGLRTEIDGIFGPDTERQTRNLQRRYGAELVDGIWGPETWTIGVTGRDTR